MLKTPNKYQTKTILFLNLMEKIKYKLPSHMMINVKKRK